MRKETDGSGSVVQTKITEEFTWSSTIQSYEDLIQFDFSRQKTVIKFYPLHNNI